MRTRLLTILGVLCVLAAVPAQAANRYVCAAGVNCDVGSPFGAGTSYATITLAVNAAGSGDVIYLKAGETFNEQVTLPNKGVLAQPIVIRSSAADSNFPAAGTRLVPTVRDDGRAPYPTLPTKPGNTNKANMPTVVAPTTSSRAFTTAAGARDYVIRFIRFTGELNKGFNELVALGKQTGQEKLADQPESITIDRCLFEIDQFVGQKTGVLANGRNLIIENSYFTNILGKGQDATCVLGVNGTGPVTIRNNFLECGGYSSMFGGDSPNMRTNADVAATSTATSIVLTNFRAGHSITDIADYYAHYVTLRGKQLGVSVMTTDGVREQSYITAINTGTNTITVSPALSQAPATNCPTYGNNANGTTGGCDVRVGAVYTDNLVTRNHSYKSMSWSQSILAAPVVQPPTTTTTTSGLAAGTYYYKVLARKTSSYQNVTIYSAHSTEVSAVLDSIGTVTIKWTGVPGATHYRVFGRTAGGQNQYWEVAASGLGTHTFTDTGTAGTTATIPSSAGDKWVAKNHFEIKQSNYETIFANILDNGLPTGGSYSGFGMWLKSNNGSPGNAEFHENKGMQVRFNVMRHLTGCFLINSQEYGTVSGLGTQDEPFPVESPLIEHNLCYDSGPQNGNVDNFAMTFGYMDPHNMTFRHNSIMHDGKGIADLQATKSSPWHGVTSWTDNFFFHNTYGIKGNGFNPGNSSMDVWWPVSSGVGSRVWNQNVVAGTYTYAWPTGTIKVTSAEAKAHVNNYGGGAISDYALKAGDPWNTAASDGTMIGADVPQLEATVTGVIEGLPAGTPTIGAATAPGGTIGVPYGPLQLTSTGGTGTRTFSVSTGSLPAGVTLSASGLLSGTPTTAGTSNFSVVVTDSLSAQSQPLALSITIVSNILPLSMTTTTFDPATVQVPYVGKAVASGGSAAYTWVRSAGSLPTGLTMNEAGDITGTPAVTGIFNFKLRVTSGTESITREFSIVVNPPSGGGPTDPTAPIDRPRYNGQALLSFSSCVDISPDTSRVKTKDLCVDDLNRLSMVTSTATTPVSYTQVALPHLHVTAMVLNAAQAHSITDAPASDTELNTGYRAQADLSRGYSECRLLYFLAGGAGTTQKAQYSTDGGTNWFALDGVSGPSNTGVLNNNATPWAAIAASAKTDVLLRMVVFGNGVIDPSFRSIAFECR